MQAFLLLTFLAFWDSVKNSNLFLTFGDIWQIQRMK